MLLTQITSNAISVATQPTRARPEQLQEHPAKRYGRRADAFVHACALWTTWDAGALWDARVLAWPQVGRKGVGGGGGGGLSWVGVWEDLWEGRVKIVLCEAWPKLGHILEEGFDCWVWLTKLICGGWGRVCLYVYLLCEEDHKEVLVDFAILN